ncbi:cya [Symbiodinium sp. KB8]|nr:cya [Symbiodinium sp. KB8]
METVILEKTIIKLGSLLALGFGEAGANIVSSNMDGANSGVNAMVEGSMVNCIAGSPGSKLGMEVVPCSLQLTRSTAQVMTFVNQIAEIVHGVVDECWGAVNKNDGTPPATCISIGAWVVKHDWTPVKHPTPSAEANHAATADEVSDKVIVRELCVKMSDPLEIATSSGALAKAMDPAPHSMVVLFCLASQADRKPVLERMPAGHDGPSLQIRRPSVALVVLTALTFPLAAGGTPEEGGLIDRVELVWPMVLMHLPLPVDKGETQEDVDALLRELADIGEKGFLTYLEKVLPHELEVDEEFAEEFRGADESRWNDGFFRWQKRVYSRLSKIRVEEILWDGKPVPALPGVSYRWDELHKFQGMKRVMKKIFGQVAAYKHASDATLESSDSRKGRFIPWVEVYRPRDFHHPHTHTGSPIVGTLVLRCGTQKQRLVFEDPRGINPPFGRKYHVDVREGDLLLFPSWASHFVDPNRGNETHVFLSFAIQGHGGPQEFDWEDDGTGAVVKKMDKRIRAKAKKGTAAPPRKERSELLDCDMELLLTLQRQVEPAVSEIAEIHFNFTSGRQQEVIERMSVFQDFEKWQGQNHGVKHVGNRKTRKSAISVLESLRLTMGSLVCPALFDDGSGQRSSSELPEHLRPSKFVQKFFSDVRQLARSGTTEIYTPEVVAQIEASWHSSALEFLNLAQRLEAWVVESRRSGGRMQASTFTSVETLVERFMNMALDFVRSLAEDMGLMFRAPNYVPRELTPAGASDTDEHLAENSLWTVDVFRDSVDGLALKPEFLNMLLQMPAPLAHAPLHPDFKVCESLPEVTSVPLGTSTEFLDEVGGWAHRDITGTHRRDASPLQLLQAAASRGTRLSNLFISVQA